MAKSPDAFRTISEVADWLDRPAHVLRFWESKFSQVKPVKRAGGRRYYRPQDMLLLGGIKKLLHDDGMTIKGVQKLLREQGVQHVAALSQPLDGGEPVDAAPVAAQAAPPPAAEPALAAPDGKDNLVAFKRPESAAKAEAPAAASGPADEPRQVSLFEFDAPAAAPAQDAAQEPEKAVEPAPAVAPAPAPQTDAGDTPASETESQAAAGPGILPALLVRRGKLPAAQAAPLLRRARAHADALRKAAKEG